MPNDARLTLQVIYDEVSREIPAKPSSTRPFKR
jgi:hypothetical protein